MNELLSELCIGSKADTKKLLCSSSILGASKSLSRPHLPFISLQTGRPMALQDVFQNDPPPSESDPLLAICITNEMYHIFCGVRTYLSLVENFQDGVQGVDHQTLCDARNLLQWHIMSLLPESQLGPVLLQLCPVYEACRLALMIFGVGIIFPLPADIAPLGHAARSMQLGLQMHSSHHVGLESEALIQAQCWCLVLGGIAAGPQEREWFVHELRHMLPMLGVTIWTELKMVLKLFLWWDLACDSAGRQLWDEVSLPC